MDTCVCLLERDLLEGQLDDAGLFFIHRDPPPSAPHPCSGEKRKGSCEPYYYFYRIFLGSKYRKKNVTQIILVDQSLIWLKVVFLSVSAGCISILE